MMTEKDRELVAKLRMALVDLVEGMKRTNDPALLGPLGDALIAAFDEFAAQTATEE